MRGLSPDTVIVKPNLIRLVRRADSTYWQAHYKLDKIGKWMRKGTGTADLEKAKEFANEEWLKAKILIKENAFVVSRKFRAVADLVLRDLEIKIAADKTKRGSANDYKAAISSYLVPFFGGYNIDRITQEVYSSFFDWRTEKMGKEMSASGQANHNAALNMIFDYAIERGYMLRTQRPVLKNTGSTGARRPDFSEKEIDRLFDHMITWAKGGKAGRPQQIRELLMMYVCFAATTGMRPGTEMDNIEWRQIDVVETDAEPILYLTLQRGKTIKKGQKAGVVLHRSCWLYLERLRAMSDDLQGMTLMEVLEKKPAKRLFRLPDGSQPDSLNKQFKRLLTDAKMLNCPTTGEERTLYSLRHYAITQLIRQGATAEQLQQQVRTSATMISKYYNHLNPLKNADLFSGRKDRKGDQDHEHDEVHAIINHSPQDSLLNFAEMTTGLSIALVLRNHDAANELAEALKVAATATSS